MKSYLFQGEADLQLMGQLIAQLPYKTTVVDFEETMMLRSVRARTRLWQENGRLIAFAFVDDFNNLRFEVANGRPTTQLEQEIVEWGCHCVREINNQTGQTHTLDTSFLAENDWQIALLERNGFVQERHRTLRFARSLTVPIPDRPFPAGFFCRPVEGEQEVERLVALHRAAFGTEKMTIERRLAIMKGPGYEPLLDLVAVAPTGQLAAFCICGLETDNPHLGYTDPIGTHPDFQRRGLAQAVVSAGMNLLRDKGAQSAAFGTSSQNMPMRKLGERLGFKRVSEKLWFSRKVDQG